MSEQYTRELLRLAVAQICQTIGYNATQTSALELLQDLLHRFLNEFSRDMHRQVEHDNRTSACLEDVTLTFSSLNISIHELQDYIGNVEPVPFTIEVPKFPVNKPSNLNFLKPGSKEVLSRPVHIFEHLPPMLPPDAQSYTNENISALQNKALVSFGVATDSVDQGSPLISTEEKKISSANSMNKIKSECEVDQIRIDLITPINSSISVPAITNKALQTSDLGRPTREIMSVVMTTGGFISPAIEGKLPEAGIPRIVDKFFGLDAPPPPTPPPPPEHIDLPVKAEKKLLEFKVKANTEKERTGNMVKKNSLPIDFKQAINESGSNGNLERNVSPKSNPSNQNIKKSGLSHSNPAQPLVALKLLKKAKKKNIGLNPNATETMASSLNDILEPNSEKLSDKARRKRLKTIQKMLKNAQKQKSGIELKKETKSTKSMSNVNNFNDIPVGIEKMLKKQAKQKQKQLKKQMTLETQKNLFSDSLPLPIQKHIGESAGEVEFLKATAQPKEVAPKQIDQIHDTKQTNSTGDQSLLPSYNKVTALPIECLPDTKNLNLENENNFVPSENLNLLEIKLSNEPDRNKLNIFKKISKAQKGAQLTPSAKQSLSLNTFTGSEGQIINLPSGTTITPAPLPMNSSILIPQKMGIHEGVLDGSSEKGSFDFIAATQPELITKPKKRGRKPGSKNQPKILPPNILLNQDQVPNPTLMKKQKKKLLNTIKFDPMKDPLLHNSIGPPANSSKLDHAAILGQIPFPNASSQMFATPTPLKASRKERKEKEKPKPLEMLSSLSPGVDAGKDIKHEQASPVNLSGIPFSPLNMLFNSNIEQNITPHQQKSRKRPANPVKNTNPSPTMLPAFLSGGHTPGGFSPHLSSNMLSMLPFAFPPRPGLIPTPGLFPAAAGLPNFSSQLSNPKSTTGNAPGLLGLGPPFFPFATMKPQNVPVLNQTQDRSKELPPTIHPYSADRSYCNVAPLVPPESMKPVTEITENSSNSLLTVAKHQQKSIAMVGKIQLNNIKKDGSGSNPNDLSNRKTGAALLSNINREVVTNSVLQKGIAPVVQCADNPALALNGLKANEKHLPTGSADDPIEVSDDSDETTAQVDSSGSLLNPIATSMLNSPQLSNPSLAIPPPLVHNPSIKMDLPGNLTGAHESDTKIITKDVKKLKKVQKHSKKNSKTTETDVSSLEAYTGNCTENLSGNDGFSKLAGGADLIPLTGTGLAYSAKTIPSTSLTASKPLNINIPSYENALQQYSSGEPEKRFNDVTILPSIQKKKSKEHKKIRKLKDLDRGKIKKKKDKKDKTREKEHLQFALGQGSDLEKRVDKEALKKFKKERKKQKQRLLANPNEQSQPHIQGISSSIQQKPMNIGSDEKPEMSPLPQSPPLTVSTIPFPSNLSESSAPSLVPKLTLKIGSSQSPAPVSTKLDEDILQTPKLKREPSPELARFSPLVTRPPKRKLSQNDNQMTNYSSENKSTLNVKSTENILAILPQSAIPPPSPWLPGGTLTASSVLLPQQLVTNSVAKPKIEERLHQHLSSKVDNISSNENSVAQRTTNTATNSDQNPVSLIAETNRPSSYVDAEGNTVWICPACGKVDDGSPMIGCDGCDAWYHWECVGISVAPNDNEDWFCRVCITRKKGFHSSGDGSDKKRKRNKKK